ncbi:hypothetical protein BSKO_05610 [Bryopsis sp. KO-2023]|nr:hypothetical protein BSKO_05610 [Bryopsis sp. KO-2023]
MDGMRALLLVAALAVASIVTPIHAQTDKPSFIVFLADDLGFNDVGFQGNTDVETPRLDALAAESVSFDNFYVHPTCAPTRASLLTGKFFLRTGVWGVHGTRDFMGLEEKTFADVLGKEGYKTGIYGKWHSGTTDGYLAWDRGFQEGCTTHLYDYLDSKVICNRKLEFTKGWTTKNIADWSIDFIKKNADEPFVLYVPFMAPHLGVTVPLAEYDWQAPRSYILKYRKKGQSEPVARLHALINFMDFQIGRILDAVDKAKISESTVVMFMSDNGADAQERFTDEEWKKRNAGLNGSKGKIDENAIRSPLLIRYPGTFKPAVVGDPVVEVEDIFPTMMDMAGVNVTDVDGTSLVPLLENPKLEDKFWTERYIYRTVPAPWWTVSGDQMVLLPNKGLDKTGLRFGWSGGWAVRQGNFKYTNQGGKESLWDIVNDPSETKKYEDEELKGRLRESMENWWNEIVADPRSFTVPIFILGRSGSSKVPAMGAVDKTTDFVTRTHIVQGDYAHPGSFLEYRVNVEKEGKYKVKARRKAKGSWNGIAKFTIDCGKGKEASLESGMNQGAWVKDVMFGDIDLPFTGENCTMLFRITQGFGTINLYWFFFEREGAKEEVADFDDESVELPGAAESTEDAKPAAPPAKSATTNAQARRRKRLRARRRAARLAKAEAAAEETKKKTDNWEEDTEKEESKKPVLEKKVVEKEEENENEEKKPSKKSRTVERSLRKPAEDGEIASAEEDEETEASVQTSSRIKTKTSKKEAVVDDDEEDSVASSLNEEGEKKSEDEELSKKVG